MDNKHYSVAAHLIHSRLQLIAKRMSLTTLNDGQELRFENYRYFYRAAQSVKQEHDVHCYARDLVAAGDLFLRTVDRSKLTSHFVVQYKKVPDARRYVTTYDFGVTISDTDPKYRWTKEDAVAIKETITKHHKIFGFSVIEKFEYK